MSLLDLPVRRPMAVSMIFVGFVVLGIVAYQRIPLEFIPPLEGDQIYVGFFRPNSEQEVVEREILLPLHARVSAMPDVAESWGRVQGGGGNYRVRFEPRTNMKVRELELRRIASDIQRSQPRGTSVGVGSMQSGTAQYGSLVMEIHVLGDADRDTLYDLADQLLAPRLAAVSGVGEANATGGSRRRLIVNVDLARAAAVGVTPAQVIEAVSRRAGDMRHVGNLESEAGRLEVIVDGRPSDVNAFAETRITPDRPVQLKHVSDISLGFAPWQSSFRVNGEEAVGIVVFKEQTANLVRLGRELRERVDELRAEVAPMGVDLVIGDDRAEDIEEGLGRLARLGFSGYLIALAVLFLFLRQWRAVAVVGVAVPVSLLGALALLYLMGLSLNMLTMGGLWLSVGLLIDNSIVVYEAVLRRLERGLDPAEAARIGLKRTLRAIVAATGTTAIVMLPAGILDIPVSFRSMIGEFIPAFLLPLGASMLVAVGLVPVLTHRLAAPAALRAVARQRETRAKAGGQRAPDPSRILFGGLVGNAMRRPSAWLTGTGIAIVATMLFAVPVAISNQAPADPEHADSVAFSAQALKGTASIDAVADAVAELERAAMAIEGVDRVTSDINEEGATMRVDLVDLDERPPDLTVSRVRQIVAEAANRARGIDVSRPGEERGGRGRVEGPGGRGPPLAGGGADEILISGPESRVLERLADDLVMRLEAVDQVGRAWQSAPRGREEIWVEPDRRGFEAFELTVDEVLPGLRFAGLGGMNAGPYVLPSGREIPVYVERVNGREPDGLKDLRRLRVHTESGVATVSALASIRQMPPPAAIEHHNGRREASVYYRLDASAPESGPARDALDEKIATAIRSTPRAQGYAVELQEQDESLGAFAEYLLWAVLLVLLVLAVTFESLTLPWLVLLSVFLAVIGAAWLMVLTDTPLEPIAVVGAVVLVGLAINPAILIVDRMQHRVRNGWPPGAAALGSVRERTRPVLMTATTTIAALWPLALSRGMENETWPPFATLIIGGLLTATLLTLLVIPVSYLFFQRLDQLFGRVGPWLVVALLAATIGSTAWLYQTETVESLFRLFLTFWLILAGLLVIIVLAFRRPELAEPETAGGPPVLDVRNLKKVYGMPGPIRQAIRAPRDFADRIRREGGSLTHTEFDWRDAMGRFGPYLILTAAPLLLASQVQGTGWKLILWLLAAAFLARLGTEVRRARRPGEDDARPGRLEAAFRVLLPWGVLGAFVAWMIVIPRLEGSEPQVVLLLPILAGVLILVGQIIRHSAVRQQRGQIGERATSGPFRHPRTLLRRLARRIGGFDLPIEPVLALTEVTFRVERGMVGILGPNGAGKTTLLRQLAGILDPTRGVINLGGVRLSKIQRVLARWVGYLPQDAGLPGGLSPREYLGYFAALYELPVEIRRERVESLLAEVGLAEKAGDKIKTLSGGMRQRVAVARTLLRLPSVIIVDEPTVGLDPRERIRFRNLLGRLARDRIVLFSTHVVEDVAVACDRVLVLSTGRLVFDGAPSDLASAAEGRVWECRFAPDEHFELPNGAILAEETPTLDGGNVRRILADAAPATDATPLEAQLQDGYLWLITHGRSNRGPAAEVAQ
ncbi:MAG: ATP-binding cassette domain-containing protein [Gammaproteobacteria bacterium]|nr:ATP-binding cassette domain-containing protein [Gammaproteobacteria bacterium]MYK48634.1 ATP-binding cassette domain-containing protein [Gammaproteobacteria bacterium]